MFSGNIDPLRGAYLFSQDRGPFSIGLCRASFLLSVFRKSLSEALRKVDRGDHGARRATLRLIRGQSYLPGSKSGFGISIFRDFFDRLRLLGSPLPHALVGKLLALEAQ